jgi:hypothetical protein
MRYVIALLTVLFVSSASAQDVFFSDSYSSPDYGYGFTTQTYGWGGQLGSPLTPYWSDSYSSADYGSGRRTSTFWYGYAPVWSQPSYVVRSHRHRLRW